MQHLLDGMSGKLGITTVITDEGIHSEVLATVLDNSGFDSIHVTENSHIPASRTTPAPARGAFYWSYDAFVALTAAALATSDLRQRHSRTAIFDTDYYGRCRTER
jgi:alkanesulfonate monooxygenase SsuD/methylene tetrahydromethanopterin reductase-like flavin-dependent oxidoreductase (luciferase family)